ncbi:MAG TPA: glycosyltransferase N-terminal domain-containing protein [Candidatus Binataceae bacterium]|nr:glycosyltransferase N-terminal domain-containing protein [Candidatus Binataceae bacterium]
MYALLSPLLFKCAHLIERIRGASSEELHSRLGYVPSAGAPVIWFHGASAGEMAAAVALSNLLRERGHHFEPVFTATNRAGLDYIRRVTPEARVASLVPWDVSDCLVRALDRWQPRALAIVETELWPRMVFEAQERGIPVFSVSARIYSGDLPRYRAIRPFIGPTLSRFTRILAQDNVERDRFIALGAPADRCVSAGNLKYMGSSRVFDDPEALRRDIGIGPHDRVVVCGSIHGDEVNNVLESIAAVIPEDVRLIVAPRHLAAVGIIERWASRRAWKYVRRSAREIEKGWRVMIVDTMGELSRFYALASCAIVGGGFERHGGHNPFEPVRAGVPALFGANFHHFDAEARALVSATPEAQSADLSALAATLRRWLDDDTQRRSAHERQLAVLPDPASIAACYSHTLEPFLTAAGV